MSEVLKLGDVALAITGSGNFTGVSHDGTLSGNGTSASPLGVIGGGAGDTSQCLPKSASSEFYPMSGNPSGFVTGGPFQPTGNYAYESSLSSKLDSSASGSFAPSGDYAYNSAVSAKLDKSAQVITAYTLQGGRVQTLNGSSIQAQYAVSANNWNGASGKLDNSASSTWYPMTGNPSGFLTAHQSLTAYVPKSSISAQSATWNNVSAMTPKSSISGNSATWNTVSAMVPKSSISSQSSKWNTVSAMVPKSSISSQSATWNTVSAKLDTSAFTSYTATATSVGRTYTGITPIKVDNTANSVSLQATAVSIDSSLRTYTSGGSALVGLAYPTVVVSNSSQATGSNIIYIVTGG